MGARTLAPTGGMIARRHHTTHLDPSIQTARIVWQFEKVKLRGFQGLILNVARQFQLIHTEIET
ncbi:MAG: hypothetical protein ETSY2_25670 [Candidatus Entotheonella gemina]|uniref:Uncharacterized protein n=1 Tax=Candidatus Entotheonella gemina TaxID=1429439 RepID=W4M4X1_9BACT|nr:MAG: hypothetical protein ETSY2_25670 [Candidatus Entotheonella gemina]